VPECCCRPRPLVHILISPCGLGAYENVQARKSSRYYRLYLTALLTGMRQGELLGLRWEDIDFLLGSVTIQRTFYRLGERQLFREPKTQTSRRTIPLPSVHVDELRGIREEQKKTKRTLGDKYEDNRLVFCQKNGKPLRAHNIVKRDFRKVIERAKVPHIRFHDLRHCHATHLLRAGVNAKVVQERLGHYAAAFTCPPTRIPSPAFRRRLRR
jgi:integrase